MLFPVLLVLNAQRLTRLINASIRSRAEIKAGVSVAEAVMLIFFVFFFPEEGPFCATETDLVSNSI